MPRLTHAASALTGERSRSHARFTANGPHPRLDRSCISRSIPSCGNASEDHGTIEAALDPITIVHAELPQLVADIVERAIKRQLDMAIVGSVESLEALLDLARATEPDVAVVGIRGADIPEECLELLMERPRVKILAIEAHEGRAYLYVLRPEQVEIGEVSPEDVVETIREAARRPSLR
jgi:hypothetical protein